MNKRDKQREQRRQEILLCSLDMFIKRGFEATKIRDIAKELNISTGLFFHYYESKEKIYEELVKTAIQGAKAVKDISEKRNSIDFFKQITESLFISLKRSPITAKMFLFMK